MMQNIISERLADPRIWEMSIGFFLCEVLPKTPYIGFGKVIDEEDINKSKMRSKLLHRLNELWPLNIEMVYQIEEKVTEAKKSFLRLDSRDDAFLGEKIGFSETEKTLLKSRPLMVYISNEIKTEMKLIKLT